jgi:hypothetical protein
LRIGVSIFLFQRRKRNIAAIEQRNARPDHHREDRQRDRQSL